VGGSHPGKKENYPWQVTAESVLCGGLSAKGIKKARVELINKLTVTFYYLK